MPKMNEDVFNKILEHIENGFSLRSACKDVNVDYKLFYDYLDKDENRGRQYARAREAQAEGFAEEIVAISDEEGDTNRSRLRIDARKWVASKLKPKVYGDVVRNEHSGADGKPIEIVIRKIVN